MFTSEQASFYAGADMNVYILLDQRVEAAGVPSWLSDWSKTDMTANSSNDVVFNVYKKLYSKGDKVSLGINCTSTGNVINYSVFAKAVTVSGKLFTQLEVFDNENSADWKVAENAAIGGSVYGDREVTYTSLPEFLIGTEYLTPACNSKNSTSDLAKFVTGDNIILYAAVDSRVSSTPHSSTAGSLQVKPQRLPMTWYTTSIQRRSGAAKQLSSALTDSRPAVLDIRYLQPYRKRTLPQRPRPQLPPQQQLLRPLQLLRPFPQQLLIQMTLSTVMQTVTERLTFQMPL